jgi:hypothetical protein
MNMTIQVSLIRSNTTLNLAEVLRIARLAVKEANNRALRLQNQTTQQLVQRVKDLKYWSAEIDRETQDLKDDNEDIVRYFRKLQACQFVTQDAVKCNEACFAVRRKRIHVRALKLTTTYYVLG